MILKNNKHAQIGATLTWFAAFVIVLFIIILFLFLCMVIAGEKKIESFSSLETIRGEKIASSFSSLSEINLQLIVLLNSPVETGKTFYGFLSTLNKSDENMTKLFNEKMTLFVESNVLSDSSSPYSACFVYLLDHNSDKNKYIQILSFPKNVDYSAGGIYLDESRKEVIDIILIQNKTLELEIYLK